MIAVELTIHGRVQGVAFRASTQDEARRLGVHGSVRNLPGGSVHVHAEGAPEAVEALVSWCHHGPVLAEVTSVERVPADSLAATDFVIVRR